MHHSFLLDEWRWTCPCGARAAERHGICRKCRARARWERKIVRRRGMTYLRKLRIVYAR